MERRNDITLLFGKKGCGKSTKARKLVAEADRAIIIDPMRENTRGAIVKSLPALIEYVGRLRHARFSVILRTLDEEEELGAVALAVHGEPDDPPLPDVTIYVDEIDRLCSPHNIPEPLFRLANYGRHFRVSLIGAARRPKRVHHDLTANADRIFIGQLHEPADADYLAEFIGKELAERVKQLSKPGEFVVWPDDLETRSDDDGEGTTAEDETGARAAREKRARDPEKVAEARRVARVPRVARGAAAATPGEEG